MMMKYLMITLISFLSISTFGQKLAVGDVAPSFNLPGIDGQPVSIENIESKVIIIDFWASWCTPCLKSVKTTLKPLYDSYDRSEVEIIGISNDIQESKWRAAVNKWGLQWKNVWDADRSLVRSYDVPAIPTYFIVDSTGKMLAANVYSNDLRSEVKKALKQIN